MNLLCVRDSKEIFNTDSTDLLQFTVMDYRSSLISFCELVFYQQNGKSDKIILHQ